MDKPLGRLNRKKERGHKWNQKWQKEYCNWYHKNEKDHETIVNNYTQQNGQPRRRND